MAIIGTLHFDFNPDEQITEEQFDKFKRKINELIDDWEMMVFTAASECGFEVDRMHPLMLDDLDCNEFKEQDE